MKLKCLCVSVRGAHFQASGEENDAKGSEQSREQTRNTPSHTDVRRDNHHRHPARDRALLPVRSTDPVTRTVRPPQSFRPLFWKLSFAVVAEHKSINVTATSCRLRRLRPRRPSRRRRRRSRYPRKFRSPSDAGDREGLGLREM